MKSRPTPVRAAGNRPVAKAAPKAQAPKQANRAAKPAPKAQAAKPAPSARKQAAAPAKKPVAPGTNRQNDQLHRLLQPHKPLAQLPGRLQRQHLALILASV